MTLTITELRGRLIETDDARPSLRRRRAERVLTALRWVAEEMRDKASMAEYASRGTWCSILDRLNAIGVSPLREPAQLAEIAEAVGVDEDDRLALIRLASVLNRYKGSKATAIDARFGALVDGAQEILREQAQSQKTEAKVAPSWSEAVLRRQTEREAA